MNEELFLGIKQYKNCLTKKEIDKLKNQIDNIPFINETVAHPSYQKKLYYEKNNLINYNYIDTKIIESFKKSCIKFLNYQPKKINIMSWVHITWKNSKKNPNIGHTHNETNPFALSGIFYLKLPKKSETTSFQIENNLLKLPAIENSWFIFYSDMWHIPGLCKSNEKRYCISADFWFEE